MSLARPPGRAALPPGGAERGAAGAAKVSGLFVGRVMHQRLQPLRHHLSYGMYTLLLDLDELDTLHQRLRWFSVGRFNLFSLQPRDHGDGTAADAAGLRAHIDAQLRGAALPTGGAIRLLAMPRILGYAFNPLSVWFCHAPGGELQAIVYEVNNTFGQRHSYLIEVDAAQRTGGLVTQRCDKQLYVSPFLGMALHYRFRVEPPAQGLSLGVGVHAPDGGAVLHARLDAQRRALTDGALLRVFLTHPLLTLKVVGGIHWEALKLWLKGARLQPRPAPPDHAFTVIRPGNPPCPPA